MSSGKTHQRWPNLFLIGAPKCGTTAMSHYLAGHPQIFMSEQAGFKEPWFFARDLDGPWRICKHSDDYLPLFENIPDNVQYWGEASAAYLYSDVAIPDILKVSPDARFIAMVRSPIEIVQALFNQHMKMHFETTFDFHRAWRLQEDRLYGRAPLPAGISNTKLYQYGPYAKLGFQLQRALNIIDGERLHIIVYEDFAADPGKEYRRVLDFLALPEDGRTEFPVLNKRVRYRYPGLQTFLGKLAQIRRRLHIPGGWGINALIDRFNAVPETAGDNLPEDFRKELVDYFRKDIELLSDILQRNLSHWIELSK